jgi:hypothetical protein
MDEKLETARDYLLQYPASSQEFEAAAEHLVWTIDNGSEDELHVVEGIARDIILKRRDDKSAMKRLTELLRA